MSTTSEAAPRQVGRSTPTLALSTAAGAVVAFFASTLLWLPLFVGGGVILAVSLFNQQQGRRGLILVGIALLVGSGLYFGVPAVANVFGWTLPGTGFTHIENNPPLS